MCVHDWWEIYVYNINVISAVGEIGPFIIQENKHEGGVIRGVPFAVKKKFQGDRQPPGRLSNETAENIAASRRKFRRKYDDSVSLR